jgi:N-acetylneuraminic acid mutarotase
VHNDKFILTNGNEVFSSSTGTSWAKTATIGDNTIDHYRNSSVVYNNTIYNIGGSKNIGGDTWEIANIVSHSTNGTFFTVAPSVSGLTGGVQQHTSVVFNGAIYTLGGYTQTVDYTNAVWKSTNGTTWTQQTNPSWSARAGHASVVYNNKLYVIGGAYGAGSEHRDVWSSSNGTTWTQETASAAWTGRNDHTVNANSKGMWLLGGHDGYFEKDLWFSPDGKTWTKVLDVPFAERACHAAVVRDGYLYIFGGVNGSWENPNYLTDIWRTYIGE